MHRLGIALTVLGCMFIVPVAVADTGTWSPPKSLYDLPEVRGLPDLFTLADGSPVETEEDWAVRRREMKAMLQYYQYGHVPPRPESVTVVESRREAHESGLGAMEYVTLEIDGNEALRFRAVFYLPKQGGPRPVIIREEGNPGHRREAPMFLEKGYIFVEYARHDLDPDKDRVTGPAQAAYPEYDWETLAVWAWCGMRLVDYLETRDDVDMDRIAITGHSRGGKMALLTAALDERIALVVPHQSGAGGAGCYRILGPGAETLAQNDKPHWYHERLRWFGMQEERLPFDQHFLKALIAPRALLCTESFDDEFANPLGSLATSVAAQPVFEFLGVPEKNGVHFRRGGHSTDAEDWARLLGFAEWQFFGKEPANKGAYWETPFVLPAALEIEEGQRKIGHAVMPNGGLVETLPFTATETTMDFRMVDSPGNRADRNHHEQGSFGAVERVFAIAQHQVSAKEYVAFLKAIGAGGSANERKQRSSEWASQPGAYNHLTPWQYPGAPITQVTFTDAIRYCNWLHNGKRKGPQGPETTEDGAYTIVDGVVGPRNPGAKYFLPTEDEWYKAAYSASRTGSGGRYVHFKGGNDTPVIKRPDQEAVSVWGMAGYADAIWEWTETPVGGLHRAIRSGAWFLGNNRQSAGRFYCNPELSYPSIGFRVARPAP